MIKRELSIPWNQSSESSAVVSDYYGNGSE
jgi:hypothetical protein